MEIKELLKLSTDELLKVVNEKYKISQNSIASAIEGVSTSVISQIRAGKYKDVNNHEEKIRRYVIGEIEKKKSKESRKDFHFAFLDEVYGSIKKGLDKGKIVLLRGDSGSGKSTTLKKFQKAYVNSIFIQAYKGMRKSEIIRLLCNSNKSKSIKELEYFVKGKILIIDEANKLSGGTLEWLRSLHDLNGVPMLWAGTDENIGEVLYKQPELNRRCRKVDMKNLREDELLEMVKSYGFKHSSKYQELLQKSFRGNLALSLEVLNEMRDFVKIDPLNDNEKVFEIAIKNIA